jgi:hypothetical protein
VEIPEYKIAIKLSTEHRIEDEKTASRVISVHVLASARFAECYSQIQRPAKSAIQMRKTLTNFACWRYSVVPRSSFSGTSPKAADPTYSVLLVEPGLM